MGGKKKINRNRTVQRHRYYSPRAYEYSHESHNLTRFDSVSWRPAVQSTQNQKQKLYAKKDRKKKSHNHLSLCTGHTKKSRVIYTVISSPIYLVPEFSTATFRWPQRQRKYGGEGILKYTDVKKSAQQLKKRCFARKHTHKKHTA